MLKWFKFGRFGLAPSRLRILQVAATGGVLAWACFHGGDAVTNPAVPAPSGANSAAPATQAAPLVPEIEPQQAGFANPVALGASTIEVVVSRNDTLDRIFRRLKLNLADLASLRALPGLKSGLDKLRPGEALRLVHRDGSLFGLERQLSHSETLQVFRDDAGFRTNVLENPLETRERTVRGVIDSSLFEAVAKAGAHDQTALALADIFGWDIDFVLDIQPGDTFTATYDEISQDGTYVKDGPITAALFVNRGREYRAVRYVDPNGRAHYYSPEGTPVRAAGDGRVQFAGRKGGYGNVLEIAHPRGVVTVYGHLSRFGKGVRTGSKVTQGEIVAYVGMSGLATGPHLHYEYRVNGAH
jgi:murein DD-endopeptidase MepM/ murein hydrolase activator NlpD